MSKYLIVGLGNPGQEYAETRHNLGWRTVETLAKRTQASFREERSMHTLLADARINEQSVLLSLPTTYMNESGRAVQTIAQYFKIPLNQILIVQDELDFAFGSFAFREGGTAGGHNGIGSIYEQTGTQQFARLRMGIGRPVAPRISKDYVLERFTPEEQTILPKVLKDGADAIECWVEKGLTHAMNLWNGVKHDSATDSKKTAPPLGSDRVV
jgi:PTH1 family peptidyl-tRNA hydrolase